ncbi:MAG TPA: SprT-like domain-containing protein [Thermoanaerobaculia bacterium]|nr:SprT-like domain-containing protein [Thermoanaerobaculia bacterium]
MSASAHSRRGQPLKRIGTAAPRPVQLELFGGDDTLPSRPRLRSVPAPVHPARPPLQASPALPGRAMSPTAPPVTPPGAPDLLRRLSRLTKGRLQSVILTDNRRTILSVRPGQPRDDSHLTLRIHRSFVGAPDEVLRAVAVFVESRRGSERARQALAVLREHFARHRGPVRPAVRRRLALETVGTALDLRELRDDLNQRFFEGRLKVEITWGKGGNGPARTCGARRTRKSTIQLGSYSYEDKLIRIHRALDQPHVPRYVVEAVVYHELLHAAIPPVLQNGRRHVHTPEFRRRERLFRSLTRAEAWVEEHLPELLRARGRK